MRIFGRDISISKTGKAVVPTTTAPAEIISDDDERFSIKALENVYEDSRSWVSIVRESFAGAWQRNVEIRSETAIANATVYACMTLIANDVGKLCLQLKKMTSPNLWEPTTNPAYDPVLRKPNHYQTRIQFFQSWVLSLLINGNTYVLKDRDDRGVVRALYVLDPKRVRTLVADDGSVFYQINADKLSDVRENVIVPAREIIHDRINTIFHPLCGTSPIFACGLAALQSQEIQGNSAKFFRNRAQVGGVLTGPHNIPKQIAQRLKDDWTKNFTGENAGKIAVLGSGLKFESMTMTAVDAQMVETLKWSSETVCSVFHVPPYKVGVGPLPSYNNVQALNVEYYSQALQVIIESIEVLIDEGLGLSNDLGVEFDIENLLRMDGVTQMNVLKEAISGSIFAPNEARAKLGLPPKAGGESPMAQQQNYSLAALAKRDAKDDPFGSSKPKPAAPAANDDDPAAEDDQGDSEDQSGDDGDEELQANYALIAVMKGLQYGTI